MNRIAAIKLKSLVEVISEQFDQKVDLVCLNITCRNPVDRKPSFGFLDVVFHTTALVVETPNIERFPLETCDDGFVLPVGIKQHLRLAVVENLCFANNGNATRLIARGRFVDECDALDDSVLIDKTLPALACRYFRREALRPFQLADIADSFGFP